jgi:hypothetical protein
LLFLPNVTLTEEQRYQKVRIMAAYDTNQVPQRPAAPKG